MKNLYNNLSNREKKLIFVSLSLLVILIVFWSVNTVALKISVLKNQYQTSSSEYSYVLNKAKIITKIDANKPDIVKSAFGNFLTKITTAAKHSGNEKAIRFPLKSPTFTEL